MITLAGKERSGTTWLERLIYRNYKMVEIDSKHKHGMFGNRNHGDCVVISKHPVEWWFSYYKLAAPAGIEFGDFDTNYFDSWNDFHYDWIQADRRDYADVEFIKYTDLYENPEDELKCLELDRFEGKFDRVVGIVSATGDVSENVFRRAERVFAYDSFPELLKELQDKTDETILSHLGYEGVGLEEI